MKSHGHREKNAAIDDAIVTIIAFREYGVKSIFGLELVSQASGFFPEKLE